jgi:phosphatidylglycerol:prolipoprotein diacylglycerol transferase
MCPELTFTVFGLSFTVASYLFFAMAGAAAGVVLAVPLLIKAGLGAFKALELLLFMAVFFLVGARLLNYLVDPQMYGDGLRLTSLRLAGLSLYGGILGAFCVFAVWSRLTRRSPWPLLDALILPSAVAFVLARIGCYLNGCCIGKATDSVFGVAFPAKENGKEILSSILSVIGVTEITAYPTQLFEAGLALLGLIPALWLYSGKKSRPGTAFLVYGIWFSAMRWAVLQLRVLPYPEIVIRVIYPSLYGLLIVSGVLLLWLRNKSSRSPKAPPADTDPS